MVNTNQDLYIMWINTSFRNICRFISGLVSSSYRQNFDLFSKKFIAIYDELKPIVFGQLNFFCVRLPDRGNSKYADLRTFTTEKLILYSKGFCSNNR